MKTTIMKLSAIKQNPYNPRVIIKDKFDKLVRSIEEFPQMLELRPIVVNADNVVLGGNMRLLACQHIGLKEVPVVYATDLTEAEQKQFVIKDNVGYGSWDWDLLANEWANTDLADWGLDVWQPEDEVDYSILDELDVDGEVADMSNNVKKAIQIEFDIEHYDEAYKLINQARNKRKNIGHIVLEAMRKV